MLSKETIMDYEDLVIDDLRNFKGPKKETTFYARNSYDGIEALKNFNSDGLETIWLDHDLGFVKTEILNKLEKRKIFSTFGEAVEENANLDEQPDEDIDDISPVIDWLIQYPYDHNGDLYPVTEIIVHTSNKVAGERMMASLRAEGYRAIRLAAEDYFIV